MAVYVDATSGAFLHQREKVMHGTGNSAYNGTVTIDTTKSGSTYSMKDPSRSNLSCQDAANNTTFSGSDDAWGNGSASSKETGCVDALFAARRSLSERQLAESTLALPVEVLDDADLRALINRYDHVITL